MIRQLPGRRSVSAYELLHDPFGPLLMHPVLNVSCEWTGGVISLVQVVLGASLVVLLHLLDYWMKCFENKPPDHEAGDLLQGPLKPGQEQEKHSASCLCHDLPQGAVRGCLGLG